MVIAQLEFLVDTLSSKMFFFYYHFYCSSIIVIVMIMIIQCWEMEKLKLVLGESFLSTLHRGEVGQNANIMNFSNPCDQGSSFQPQQQHNSHFTYM